MASAPLSGATFLASGERPARLIDLVTASDLMDVDFGIRMTTFYLIFCLVRFATSKLYEYLLESFLVTWVSMSMASP